MLFGSTAILPSQARSVAQDHQSFLLRTWNPWHPWAPEISGLVSLLPPCQKVASLNFLLVTALPRSISMPISLIDCPGLILAAAISFKSYSSPSIPCLARIIGNPLISSRSLLVAAHLHQHQVHHGPPHHRRRAHRAFAQHSPCLSTRSSRPDRVRHPRHHPQCRLTIALQG